MMRDKKKEKADGAFPGNARKDLHTSMYGTYITLHVQYRFSMSVARYMYRYMYMYIYRGPVREGEGERE